MSEYDVESDFDIAKARCFLERMGDKVMLENFNDVYTCLMWQQCINFILLQRKNKTRLYRYFTDAEEGGRGFDDVEDMAAFVFEDRSGDYGEGSFTFDYYYEGAIDVEEFKLSKEKLEVLWALVLCK